MSRTIALTQGKVTTVSDEDYAWAMQWKWCAKQSKKGSERFYAYRNAPRTSVPRPHFWLHREIAARAGLPYSQLYDHRDGDGLNNQRDNIRPCTARQNQANRRKKINALTSRFKGVTWEKRRAVWAAWINRNGKTVWLGYHASEESARQSYVDAAKKEFGEFARS